MNTKFDTTNPTIMSHMQNEWKIVLEVPEFDTLHAHLLKICPDQTSHIEFKNGPKGNKCIISVPSSSEISIWDIIHQIAQKADDLNIEIEIEPLSFENFPVEQVDKFTSRAAGAGFDYMSQWPPVTDQEELPLGWHLDDNHSQLGSARDYVWNLLNSGAIKEPVKIAHFDTGVFPNHPVIAANKHIRMDLSKSFIDGEQKTNPLAIDLETGGSEQHGHGTGTIGLLSGWRIDPQFTDGQDIGYIGAIPFATVIPMRIADSVLIFNTENFTEALEEAIKMGCEVITMSMGGKPSRRMAKAINKAYEAGVTIVTAAGNYITQGFARIGPPTVVYPARFPRVIAACGVCSNHLPYDFDAQLAYGNRTGSRGLSMDFMQGNWGPNHAMNYAIASYTPNVPWIVDDKEHPVKKSGGGTSAATPQVAAAAALWIMKNKEELKKKGYYGTWKQVEAVRYALFQSADKNTFVDSPRYYGNGILKAMDALNIPVPELSQLKMADKSESTWTGIIEALGLFLNRKGALLGAVQKKLFSLELESLLLDYPEVLDNDTQTRSLDWEENTINQLIELVRNSEDGSEQLRELIFSLSK